MNVVDTKFRKRKFPGPFQFNKHPRETQILEPILPSIRQETMAVLKNVDLLDKHDPNSPVINGHSFLKLHRLTTLRPILQLLAVFKTDVFLSHKYHLNK